eukprot:5567285-Prymnesium_polylepis.2
MRVGRARGDGAPTARLANDRAPHVAPSGDRGAASGLRCGGGGASAGTTVWWWRALTGDVLLGALL